MRVILDSNIIIAAFATRGLCHAVFELCLDRHEIILSSFLLNEIESNLARKLKLPNEIRSEIKDFLIESTIHIEAPELSSQICRDPSDDMVLSLTRESNAEYVVTGDEDLLSLKQFKSTKIISPREFWEIARHQKE
jgi:putative PIN family toxin of toxin-antitoxin system